jgi:hypothetical protein
MTQPQPPQGPQPSKTGNALLIFALLAAMVALVWITLSHASSWTVPLPASDPKVPDAAKAVAK